jgi:hypothetical protein
MWSPIIAVTLPSAFHGLQGGVGSWFRGNNSQDSTNGHSWCAFPYKDSSPVFAIDMAQMTNGTNANWPSSDWYVYGKEYCGLEAKVYNPITGVSMLMYVGDGFDHKWVRSPGSIDIMINSFGALIGKYPTSKQSDYIANVQWEFTGNRNPQYAFGSTGTPF